MSRQLSTILNKAIRESEDRVYDTLEYVVSRLPDDARLLDELERTIDDVADPATHTALMGLLRRLDANRDELRYALTNLNVHGGFDPVRVVAKDAASGCL